MRASRRRSIIATTTILVAAGALAGCTSTAAPATSMSPTATTDTPPPPAATTTVVPSTTAAAPSTANGTQGSAADTGTGAAGRAPNGSAARCTTNELSGAIAGTDGAAGTVHAELQLTNTGTSDCTLQGWPGVSLVGGGDGKQIGSAAVLDRSTVHDPVALKPGTTAVAELSWTQAGTMNTASCRPEQGDGFRVYPPGSTTSIYVRQSGITGCQSAGVTLFTVGALR